MGQITLSTREAPPKAGAMVESLRGMGYSISTAIADIIDNSISAEADVINVNFHWRGPDSAISIMDNGSGMLPMDLERAMRLGDTPAAIQFRSAEYFTLVTIFPAFVAGWFRRPSEARSMNLNSI